jgi:hypothetical protein
MVQLKATKVFARLPDQVVIAGVAEGEGRYSVHVKLNEPDGYATLGCRLNVSKALALVDHLKVYLEMPDEAAYMEGRNDITLREYGNAALLYCDLIKRRKGACEKGSKT